LVESVPGRVRFSLVLLPAEWLIASSAIASTIQTAITG
jgi:hypothetical protein